MSLITVKTKHSELNITREDDKMILKRKNTIYARGIEYILDKLQDDYIDTISEEGCVTVMTSSDIIKFEQKNYNDMDIYEAHILNYIELLLYKYSKKN